jgi:hypothetical protein
MVQVGIALAFGVSASFLLGAAVPASAVTSVLRPAAH